MLETPWLTVDEAATYIRAKSGRLIRNAIRDGDLPSYRYGRSEIRLKAVDLDAWLESRPYEPESRTA
jgi:excisionase family DNA binding protein